MVKKSLGPNGNIHSLVIWNDEENRLSFRLLHISNIFKIWFLM